MLRFLLKRLAGFVIVVWSMTFVMFGVIHAIPGDPVAGLAGFGTPRYVIDAMREQLGLDRPLYVQYLKYVTNLLRGDFGISIETRNPVLAEMGKNFAASAELVLVALLIAVPLGVALGIAAAAHWGRPTDGLIRFVSLLGAAAPLFWVALVFQIIFFRQLKWFPVDGRIDFSITPPTQITGLYLVDSLLTRNGAAFWSSLRHIVLPAVALALNSLGLLVRQTRASLLQVITADYIRTARAKGLPERIVLYRHALKNAAIPITTEIGLQFGIILGATFLVEIVFSWPGLGLYAVRAILNLDYPAVLGVAQLFTFVYVVANFLVDASYPLFDPRITL
ncbi:MAG: ABC transporter permease [Ardenticatenaceae bacterium]|nr:ABC transporter permease [Ardenticatenaceae bacterium]HBY94159.1 peptide ABC transporter permease [Chloroflexota bacterium]